MADDGKNVLDDIDEDTLNELDQLLSTEDVLQYRNWDHFRRVTGYPASFLGSDETRRTAGPVYAPIQTSIELAQRCTMRAGPTGFSLNLSGKSPNSIKRRPPVRIVFGSPNNCMRRCPAYFSSCTGCLITQTDCSQRFREVIVLIRKPSTETFGGKMRTLIPESRIHPTNRFCPTSVFACVW